MKKPYVVVTPHAIARFREVLEEDYIKEASIKKHLITMYNEGIPWGGGQYRGDELILTQYKGRTGKEVVLACVKKAGDKSPISMAIIKTVLRKEHAMANIQSTVKHPINVW